MNGCGSCVRSFIIHNYARATVYCYTEDTQRPPEIVLRCRTARSNRACQDLAARNTSAPVILAQEHARCLAELSTGDHGTAAVVA